MTTKTTVSGRTYEIEEGRRFVWHPLDDNDEAGNLDDIRIPLRMKLKVLRTIGLGRDLDADAMFEILGSLIPNQAETLDEMDVNDFMAMFSTWQAEYTALNGASLGEPESSST